MATAIELSVVPAALRTVVVVIKAYYLVFALISIIGGIMGYVKAKSVISVVSGSVSGVVLIAASLMLPEHPIRAYVPGLLVSVLLAGKFVPDFIHKKTIVPGGLMALLSVVGIVLTLLAWYGK